MAVRTAEAAAEWAGADFFININDTISSHVHPASYADITHVW